MFTFQFGSRLGSCTLWNNSRRKMINNSREHEERWYNFDKLVFGKQNKKMNKLSFELKPKSAFSVSSLMLQLVSPNSWMITMKHVLRKWVNQFVWPPVTFNGNRTDSVSIWIPCGSCTSQNWCEGWMLRVSYQTRWNSVLLSIIFTLQFTTINYNRTLLGEGRNRER